MPLPLPPERYLASIRADADGFLAATSAAPTAAVAACPGWDNTALLDHMGDVFHWAAAQVRTASTEMVRPDMSAKTDPEPWFVRSRDALLDALAAADPEAAGWNWAGVPTLSFYWRRMASEIAVHRVDAQRAAGLTEDPIDAAVATDAIDELIEVGMQARMAGPNHDFPDGTLHLHRTDGEGEWLLAPGDEGLTVTHEHAKGDVAARGSAHDLLLWLWGRGRGQLDIFGDDALADAWAAVAP